MANGKGNAEARDRPISQQESGQERIGRDPEAGDIFSREKGGGPDTSGGRDEQRQLKRPRYDDGGNRGAPRDRNDGRDRDSTKEEIDEENSALHGASS